MFRRFQCAIDELATLVVGDCAIYYVPSLKNTASTKTLIIPNVPNVFYNFRYGTLCVLNIFKYLMMFYLIDNLT